MATSAPTTGAAPHAHQTMRIGRQEAPGPLTEATFSSLRDSTLREHSGTAVARTTTSAGMFEPTRMYRVPGTATTEERMGLFLALVLAGTSLEKSGAKWRTFVLTTIAVAFPQIGAKIAQDNNTAVSVVELDAGAMKHLETLSDVASVLQTEETTDTARKEAKTMIEAEYTCLPHLPTPNPDAAWELLGQCRNATVMYGYTSLVLFLAGKTITAQNRGAIAERRPNAIERKYNLGAVACLTGGLKMSNVAHDMVHTGYVYMSGARKTIFEEVAGFSRVIGDQGVEVAATTTRLMEYSGMQHVVLIDRYLSADQNALQIPVLSSAITAYASSLRALQAYPAPLRPFYKLIHGDTVREFNRKDVEALLVVAVKMETRTNPTLAQYNLPENANEIMSTYEEYAKMLA